MAALPVMTHPEPPGYAAEVADLRALVAAVNRALAPVRRGEVRLALPSGLDVVVERRTGRHGLLVRRLGAPVTLHDVALCCAVFEIPQESVIAALSPQRNRSRDDAGQVLYWHGLTLTWPVEVGAS